MEGVSEKRERAGETEEEAEEEERKSLVSSTHLSSSEYSAGIGKAIHFLPDHIRQKLPLCCYGSAQLPRSLWQLSQPQSHRDVDANILTHTHTHTAIHVNPYLPPPTRKQKYYRRSSEREEERKRRAE